MEAPKTVLITGATRGIGLTFVEQYTKNGWNVIAVARNLETTDNLKALKPYKIVQLDASDEQSILSAAQELQGEAIDLLINNAGICIRDKLDGATKDALMSQFEVNAVGPFLITRAFLPHLRAAVTKNKRAIVGQISSLSGSIASNDGGSHYGYRSSKAALNMINASLAHDLIKENIISISIHPGYVGTEMNSYAGPMKTEECFAYVSDILTRVTETDSGKFFNYDGTIMPW